MMSASNSAVSEAALRHMDAYWRAASYDKPIKFAFHGHT